MKKPFDPGSPIDNKRYRGWVTRFGSYRSGVGRATIENWLSQFKKKDKDLAARVLDAVLFFSQDQITNNFRTIMSSLEGWSPNKTKRKGRWFFVAMSSSAGESGDSMLYLFRIANNLDHRSHNEIFISRSELVSQKLTPEDTVVLLDDFSGTGGQACEAWEEIFSELVAGAGKVYLIVIAATKDALKRINKETEMSAIPAHSLTERDNIFSNKCAHFTKAEKEMLLEYNKKADKDNPKGYGDCGLLVVFHHKCPNNSLPILHKDHSKWSGIFPSHD